MLTTILGILFFGCYAVVVFVSEPTTKRIAEVVAGVSAAVVALRLLVGLL